nr:MAG TPA: Protein of unknown function (DUF1804) [Caudoviricetes sp.]
MAVDWLKIRNDYINGGGSYRKLAEKYSVSFATLRDRAIKENWKSARDRQRNKVVTKTEQKTAEKIAEQEADRIARLLSMSDRLGEQLDRAIGELNRQMVRSKVKYREIEYNDPGAPGKPTKETINEEEAIEVVEGTIDRLGLQQISVALKNLRDVISSVDTGDTDALKKAKELLGGVDSVI